MKSAAGSSASSDPPGIKSMVKFFKFLGQLSPNDGALYFFRGHASRSYRWEPSIYRKQDWILNEDKLFREILLRCPQEFTGLRTTFEMLVKMQHYSFPTRLMDMTANPLVALYFACLPPAPDPDQTPDPDGCVGVFRIPREKAKYFDSDTVSIVANIAKLPKSFSVKKDSKGKLRDRGKLLDQIRQEKPSFLDQIKVEDLGKAVFVKAKLDNPRIIRQDGAFFLFGIDQVKTKCSAKVQDYESPLGHFIVPEEEKDALKHQLEELSICEASLFPEIDIVSKYVKDADWLKWLSNI
jgi:hypothetical protein